MIRQSVMKMIEVVWIIHTLIQIIKMFTIRAMLWKRKWNKLKSKLMLKLIKLLKKLILLMIKDRKEIRKEIQKDNRRVGNRFQEKHNNMRILKNNLLACWKIIQIKLYLIMIHLKNKTRHKPTEIKIKIEIFYLTLMLP